MSAIHFLISGEDQANIVPDSITLEDISDNQPIVAGQPNPQSLRVAFMLADRTKAPQIRPMYSGTLTFIPDGTPTSFSATSEVVESAYDNWNTTGTLMVTVGDARAVDRIPEFALEVVPNVLWYTRVRITKKFLFETLATGLEQLTVSSDRRVTPADAEWHQRAIANFLAGTYNPPLTAGDDPVGTGDDVARLSMPELLVAADGSVEFRITAARSTAPQDGPDDFTSMAGTIPVTDPAYPRHGRVPARHVYRALAALFPGVYAGVLLDKVVASWPDSPRFRPVYFTRTFKLIPNTSLYFPVIGATVDFVAADGARETRYDGPVPAHGVFFVREDPGNKIADDASLGVTLQARPNDLFTGLVRWLDGTVAKPWQSRGGMTEILLPASAIHVPHVIVRLPNAYMIALDPPYRCFGGVCSYISMRRAVRGLIDNCVTGGRLIHEDFPTHPTTLDLLDEAFASAVTDPEDLPSDYLKDRLPSPTAFDAANMFLGKPIILRRVLAELFPQPTGLNIDLAPSEKWAGNVTGLGVVLMEAPRTLGEVAYWIWQSELAYFEHDTYGPYFAVHHGDHIGRGGPGAAVALGIATFVVNPELTGYDPAADNVERIKQLAGETGAKMMAGADGSDAGLKRPAVLQFWDSYYFFDAIKRRDTPMEMAAGHSPYFWQYRSGAEPGFLIVDQFSGPGRDQFCDAIDSPPFGIRIKWEGHMPEVWVAANWDD